jgi:hypothetical protein
MYEENENLLLYIPEHAREWEISGETNLVIIKKPKFQSKFLKKYLLPRLSRPDFRIRLDEFGSFVWKNIDGRASVMEIGDRMRDEFGGKIEPVYERLGSFVQTLYNTKCIIYLDKTAPPDS